MKGKEQFITTVVNGFQHNRGKASLYCFNNDIIPELIKTIIVKFVNKNPGSSIFIVTDKYELRQAILKVINNSIANLNGCCLRVLTKDYVKIQYNYRYTFTITIGVNDAYGVLEKLNRDSKFMLAILTKNIMNNQFITDVRKILPDINTAGLVENINSDNIYSPVEEHLYGVDLSYDDNIGYNKFTEYINTSISIFGSLDTITKCKNGDTENNISAVTFRNDLAHKNGWNENLDTSVDFIKQIDNIYNPNVLLERACNFFTISKQRRDLLANNAAKLEVIKNIVDANINKKILILSKSGEFAAAITKYLNNKRCICADYHDAIEDATLLNDAGEVIVYKSGANKGKPRIVGAQYQSTANEQRYNNGFINVLSAKCSSNTKLKIACDIVILTSALYEDIVDIKKRFTNVKFMSVPTVVYKLYCNNTIETEKLNKDKFNKMYTIIEETKNNAVYDENTGCVTL